MKIITVHNEIVKDYFIFYKNTFIQQVFTDLLKRVIKNVTNNKLFPSLPKEKERSANQPLLNVALFPFSVGTEQGELLD